MSKLKLIANFSSTSFMVILWILNLKWNLSLLMIFSHRPSLIFVKHLYYYILKQDITCQIFIFELYTIHKRFYILISSTPSLHHQNWCACFTGKAFVIDWCNEKKIVYKTILKFWRKWLQKDENDNNGTMKEAKWHNLLSINWYQGTMSYYFISIMSLNKHFFTFH